MITNQPAKHTDDRPAETIPNWRSLSEILIRDYGEEEAAGYLELIHKSVERTGRAETRIEVLEAALRDALTIAEADSWHSASTGRQIVYRAGRAALAAPSGSI